MKLDHLTLLVSSLDASAPFYDALLPLVGLRKQKNHVWTDDEGFYIQFLQARPETRPYERYGAGLNHMGFGASDEQKVREIAATMREAGFPTPEIQNLGGSIALFMKDPDGMRCEITYYPPGVSVVD